MIQHSQLSDINLQSPEGKLLMAAVAILTSIEYKHISSGKWGGNINPDTAVKQITDLANKIYHKQEWEEEQKRINRDNNINKILNNE